MAHYNPIDTNKVLFIEMNKGLFDRIFSSDWYNKKFWRTDSETIELIKQIRLQFNFSPKTWDADILLSFRKQYCLNFKS